MDEKVDKNEARELSKEINATFKFTSAMQNVCVDELFKELGQRFIKSNFMLEFGSEYFEDKDNFKINDLEDKIKKNKKKGCC